MPRLGQKQRPPIDETEFIKLFEVMGATQLANHLNVTERSVYQRRRAIEERTGRNLSPPLAGPGQHHGRLPLEIKDGSLLVGSDFHIWPGEEVSTCLRAFKKFIDDIRPEGIILNGDVMDFPRISRYPQNWESAPQPQEELEAVQDHLNDFVKLGKRGSHKIWTLGNHDARFERYFANSSPEMQGISGVHLADHFPLWQKGISCFVNSGHEAGATMIKHRFKGGIHATRNNTLNAGISMVTGHLHSQNIRPLSDYSKYERYGVDTGCVADRGHRAFSYTEDNPLDWRSGFVLLTWKDYRLLYPELITKWSEDAVQFRGKIIKV